MCGVSECDGEASTVRPCLTGHCCVMKKIINDAIKTSTSSSSWLV